MMLVLPPPGPVVLLHPPQLSLAQAQHGPDGLQQHVVATMSDNICTARHVFKIGNLLIKEFVDRIYCYSITYRKFSYKTSNFDTKRGVSKLKSGVSL